MTEEKRANQSDSSGRNVKPASPFPPPPVKPNCDMICGDQSAYIKDKCSRKFHLLSCRCSGCNTDDIYPVIAGSSDAPMLNTAYNGQGGFIPSGAGTDAHWEVALGDVNNPGVIPSSGWIAAYVFQLLNSAGQPIWLNSPFFNANWISYYIDGKQSSNNEDAYFRYKFNLSSAVDPSTFSLTMEFFADNCVYDIYVNSQPQKALTNGASVLPQGKNNPQYSDPYDYTGFIDHGQYNVSIVLDNNWRQCENEIVVYVKSSPGYLGFLAQNAVKVDPNENPCDCHCDCAEVKFPDIKPRICVAWGDSDCDCIETDDVEVLCITVCNCYSNVTFSNFVICQIQVTDMAGNPVPVLPDGTPSVQVIPSGPICFGDIGPCANQNEPSCVSREIVLWTRGAIGKNYRLVFNGICFDVCHHYQSEQCFIMNLCQD